MTGEETLDDRRTEEDGGDEGGEQEEDAPTEGGVILCTSYQVPNDDVHGLKANAGVDLQIKE